MSYGVSTAVAAAALWLFVKLFPARSSSVWSVPLNPKLFRRSERVAFWVGIAVCVFGFFLEDLLGKDEKGLRFAAVFISLLLLVPTLASVAVVWGRTSNLRDFYAAHWEHFYRVSGRAYLILSCLLLVMAVTLLIWALVIAPAS
jgi:hypothetical protein